MKKWMNVLCVLILALTLLDLVSNFCFSGIFHLLHQVYPEREPQRSVYPEEYQPAP